MQENRKNDNDNEIMKIDDALKLTTYSRRTFERMKADGLIPHIRYGRTIRYRRSDLLKAMERLVVRG